MAKSASKMGGWGILRNGGGGGGGPGGGGDDIEMGVWYLFTDYENIQYYMQFILQMLYWSEC